MTVRLVEDTERIGERLDAATSAAFTVADRMVEHIEAHSTDAMTFALAVAYKDVRAVVVRLRRELGVSG